MFIEAILVSIVIGLIRGGKFRRLRYLNYKNMWILISGIAIQYMLIFLSGLDGLDIVNNIMLFTKEIQVLSYALILFGIITNIKYKSLWLILAGYFMNFIVIWRNGWKMPILLEAVPLIAMPSLKEMVETGRALYIPITQGTKLPALGNIIVFADPYPIAKIISMGDLIVGFGVFILIQEIMLGKDSFMRRRKA